MYWFDKDIRAFSVTGESIYETQAGQLFEQIIKELRQNVDCIFVSFDTDSINSKFMPGVSAPGVVGGLSSR